MIEPVYRTERVRLYHGRCEDVLPCIPSGIVDAVISDPIYPEIDRSYGRMSEADWHAMMDVVVPECRRVLKPSGSAVFILQPNSNGAGSVRPWLWDFLAKWCRLWNQVQDIWWWNYTVLPAGHAIQGRLTRPSVKACVWLGSPDCYRDQDSVLWSESKRNIAMRCGERVLKKEMKPSGHGVDRVRCGMAAVKRGGVTPFNLLPIANADSQTSAGANGHGAGTPEELCSWWTRYIVPPDNATVLDPFNGSGTVGKAALEHGASYVGIEKESDYIQTSRRRLEAAERDLSEQLFP